MMSTISLVILGPFMKITIHMLSILKFIHIYFIVTLSSYKLQKVLACMFILLNHSSFQDLCVILLIWI